jgi:hypothetical protein
MFVNNRMDFRAGDVVGVKDTTTNEIMFGPIKLKEKRRNREWTVALGGNPHFNNAYVYEDEIFHWWPLEMMKMGNEVPAETNVEEAREYYSTHRWPTVPRPLEMIKMGNGEPSETNIEEAREYYSTHRWPTVTNTGYEEGDPSVFNLPHFGSRRFKGEFPALRNIPDAVEGKLARRAWDEGVGLPFQNGPGVKHFAAFWPRTLNPERRESRKRKKHIVKFYAEKERMREETRQQTWKNYLERVKREANIRANMRANMRKNLNSAPANHRPIFSLSNHNKGKHPLSNILDGGRRTRRRRR